MDATKKNILTTAISTIGNKSVRVIEQLFLIPFFISTWGAAYYGEWLTLTIIPSVIAFSDLGLGSAAANSFVLKYAEGSEEESLDILKTGFVCITALILIALILVGFAVLLAFKYSWFENSIISPEDSCYAVLLMIAAKLANTYIQLYEATFRAARRVAYSTNIQTFNGLLNICVGLVILLLGYGVVAFALGQLVVAILENIFFAKVSSKVLRFKDHYRGKISPKHLRNIFAKGLGYLMSPVWQVILFQGTTFIVRITLGPIAVASFNTVRTLTRSVNQMYSIINSSVFPEIQYEIGKGNPLKAKKILINAIKVTAALACLGFLVMSTLGLPAYNWWTSNDLAPPYFLWIILVSATAINACWWTAGSIFRAVNRPYELSFAGLFFSLIALAVTYVCCGEWGLPAAGIGSLAFEVLMALYVLPVSFKVLNQYVPSIKIS